MWFVTLVWLVIFYQRSFHLVSGYSETVLDFDVIEEQPPNTLVGKVELNPECNYRISSSPTTSSLLNLDLKTGEIRTSSRINREQIPYNVLELVLVCQQQASITVIRLKILDVNDNSPLFSNLVQNLSIIESAPIGSRFLLPLATDPDSGANGSITSYTLRSHDQDSSDVFRLVRASDERSGDSLFLQLDRELDREEKDAYALEIAAYDGGSPSRNGTTTIFVTVEDANDNYPVFNRSSYEVEVDAKAHPGQVFTTVFAADKDSGVNSKLKYRLVDDPSGQFQIDESTGIIISKVAKLNCSKFVECTTPVCAKDACILTIEAMDQGTPSLSGRTFVSIRVNDSDSPDLLLQFKIFPLGSLVAVINKNATNGTIVAVVSVHQKNPSQSAKIILKSGNENGVFRLDSGNNFAILRVNDVPKTGTKRAYNLEFEATSNDRASGKILEVILQDHEASIQFPQQNITIDVPEDARLEMPIYQIRPLTYSDTLRYKIDSIQELPFSMDELTGFIKVTRSLEFPTSYDLRISVFDTSLFLPSESLFLYVNVIRPKKCGLTFAHASYEFFVPEDHPTTKKVAQIRAYFADNQSNGPIKYLIMENSAMEIFRINGETGEVFLKRLLDFEAKTEHSFHVMAESPTAKNFTRIKMVVQDTNDEIPYFDLTEKHINLDASDSPGRKLLKLEAFDKDKADVGRMSFVALDGAVDMFSIEKNWVVLKEHINQHQFKDIQLIVGAKDTTGHFSSNNLTLHIHWVPDKTKVPNFITTRRSYEVLENAPKGTVLETFRVQNQSTTLKYRLITAVIDALEIDPILGELKTLRPIDREQHDTIKFTVIAETPNGSAYHDGVLKILDENDNSPTFHDWPKKTMVVDAHNFVIGAPVGRIEAFDLDQEENGTIRYNVDSEYVQIDSETGVFSLSPKILGNDQLQFTVIGKDQGQPSRNSSIIVVVKVENKIPVVSINETTRVGDTVVDLNPIQDSSRFYFSIKDARNLNISNFDLLIDGRLILRLLSREEAKRKFYLPIIIEDTLLESSYEALVEVHVQNRKNQPPRCPTSTILSFEENAPIGTFIGQLQGSNPDTGLNGILSYRLLDNLDKFLLEPHTGILKTRAIFDAKTQKEFKVHYAISDIAEKPSKAECSATVKIMDVNDWAPMFNKKFYYANIPFEKGQHVIDPKIGSIRSTADLIPDALYNISVIATVHGDPSLSSRTFILIRTEPDTNILPKFDPMDTITLSEGTELGTIVAIFEARAHPQSLTYELANDELPPYFELDPYSGDLMLVRPLDYERVQEISITVMAKSVSKNASQKVVIKVLDENDHAPLIVDEKFIIQENLPNGTLVGNILVNDMDSGKNGEVFLDILYQLPQGDDFSIQGSSIITKRPLDREDVREYKLMIRARDSGASSKESRKLITVEVSDQNELPSCNSILAFFIREVPFRQKIWCQDLDESINGSLSFQLVNETALATLEQDGTLVVYRKTQEPITSLHIIVSDRNGNLSKFDPLRSSVELFVDLIFSNEHDLSPSFYKFDAYLNASMGTKIGKISTESSATFYIVGLRSVRDAGHENPFIVDKNSGEIHLARILQQPDNFKMEIVAVDVDGQTKSVQVTVEVKTPENDFFLLKKNFFEYYVNESSHVGTLIGNLSPSLKTSDVRFRWSDDTAEHQPFEIDGISGNIISKNLDYEKSNLYIMNAEIYSKTKKESILCIFHILDTNDNPPIFPFARLNLFVREGAPIGSFIGQAKALDADSSENAKVLYQLIDSPKAISVDPFTGIIRVADEITHDQAAFYKFKIKTTDQGGLSSEVDAYLFVEDVNNHPPKFLLQENKAEMNEDASIGSIVYQFKFTDADSVNNFHFKLDVSTDPFQQFSIDDEGRVRIAKNLDRENMANYELKVTLCDDFPPSIYHCVQARLKIKVHDANDNPPRFEAPTIFMVSENSLIGTVVGTLAAIDTDLGENATILYRILPESLLRNEFVVDPVLGYLQVNTKLDREKTPSYAFIIEAYDNGWPRLSTQQEITIKILDEDDNAPTFIGLPEKPFEVLESASVGYRITCLKYEDLDEGANAAAIFEIVHGDPKNQFRIGTFSGCLYVNSRLDFEAQQTYSLNISMKGFVNDSFVAYTSVDITILDVNDEKPYFVDGSTIHFDVAEKYLMPYPISLGFLNARDRDLGINGIITYSLLDADPECFSINSTSGELLLLKPFENMTNTRYEFAAQASDSGSPRMFSTAKVVIRVKERWNDHKPVFEQPYYYAELPENVTMPFNILRIRATDEDNVENGRILYSIANNEYVPFSIDRLNGTLTLIDPLDYETKNRYVIQVRAQDNGDLLQSFNDVNITIEVIDVRDNTPVIRNSRFDVSIRPNLEIGEVVHIVDACDFDPNATIHYGLSGNDATYFTIDNYGVIRASQSFGSKKEFAISVSATDDVGMSTSASFSFYVNHDGKFPKFKDMKTEVQIFENITDSFLVQFEATEKKSSLRYTIASGDCFENFDMEPSSGRLFAKQLDRERIPSYHLFIAVTDTSATPVLTSYTNIAIEVLDSNDNKPRFEQPIYKIIIPENDVLMAPFLQVHASDYDTGQNGEILYSIIDGNIGHRFEIDSKSGELRANFPLDRESFEKYHLVVESRDQGKASLHEICYVEITVLDENDNPPKFSNLLNAKVREDLPVGEIVFKVLTTDPDAIENTHNTYSLITERQGHRVFEIDSKTGLITLREQLDRETENQYRMKVVVNDGLFSVSTTLTMTVEDVNDNAPIFDRPSYAFEVHQNLKAGALVGRVQAQDPDEGENSTIYYMLEEESPLFEIDPLSGEIMILQELSNVTTANFELYVFAFDRGNPPKYNSTNVQISMRSASSDKKSMSSNSVAIERSQFPIEPIVDSYDASPKMKYENNPKFTDTDFIFGISRKSKNSTIIGNLTVIDSQQQQSKSRETRFFVEPNEHIHILHETGELVIGEPINSKATDSLTIAAIVKNHKLDHNPPSITRVQIMLDDYAPTPVFPEEVYSISVNETRPQEHVLLNFNFIMPEDVLLQILRGNDDQVFCIDHTILLLCSGLSRSRRSHYSIQLGVLSNGLVRSRTRVDISWPSTSISEMFDLHQNPIVWVRENVKPEGRIMRIKPKTSLQNRDELRFRIAKEEMQRVFAIDERSGVLTTRQTLDREKLDAYVFPVQVYVVDRPDRSVTYNVTVFVDDVDDNPTENGPITVTIFTRMPTFTGTITKLYPPDEDSIDLDGCSMSEVSMSFHMDNSCTGSFEIMPIGTNEISLNYENMTYEMVLKVQKIDEFAARNSIQIEFVAAERTAAVFLQKFDDSLEEMKLMVSFVSFDKKYRFRMQLSILDRYGRVLPPVESQRIVERFYAKNKGAINIFDFEMTLTSMNPCQERAEEVEFLTLRSKDHVWHISTGCFVDNSHGFRHKNHNSTTLKDVIITDCVHDCDYSANKTRRLSATSFSKILVFGGTTLLILLLCIATATWIILCIRRRCHNSPKSKPNSGHRVSDIHLVPSYDTPPNAKYYTVENYVNEHLHMSQHGCTNDAYSQRETASERSIGSSQQSLQYQDEPTYHYVDTYLSTRPKPKKECHYETSQTYASQSSHHGEEIYPKPMKSCRKYRY